MARIRTVKPEPLFVVEADPSWLPVHTRWYSVCRPKPVPRDHEEDMWAEWYRARGLDPYKQRRAITRKVREAIIERDGYVCGICGLDVDPSGVHIDHKVPVALGGGNELENLQVAHAHCNLSKGARVREAA